MASERFGPERGLMFQAIEHLSDLPHLRRLTIESNDARDEELTSLKGLTELRTLSYTNTMLGCPCNPRGAANPTPCLASLLRADG